MSNHALYTLKLSKQRARAYVRGLGGRLGGGLLLVRAATLGMCGLPLLSNTTTTLFRSRHHGARMRMSTEEMEELRKGTPARQRRDVSQRELLETEGIDVALRFQASARRREALRAGACTFPEASTRIPTGDSRKC